MKQLRAILLLPGIIAVVIPATILYFTGIVWPPSPWNAVIGSLLRDPWAGPHGLDESPFRHDWAWHPGSVEPATEARRAWRLPACPKSDDYRGPLHSLG